MLAVNGLGAKQQLGERKMIERFDALGRPVVTNHEGSGSGSGSGFDYPTQNRNGNVEPYLNSDDQLVSLGHAPQHLDDFRKPFLERGAGRRRTKRDTDRLHVGLVPDHERLGAVQQDAAMACAGDKCVGPPRLGQATHR